MKNTKDIKLRIMEKVVVNKHSQCWELVNCKSSGYGEISINGKGVKTHRASYEAFIGKIPDGLVIDHLCRNPRCVNPTHLEPVTNEENTRRGNFPASVNARKTHCIRGHELAGENLKVVIKKRYGKDIKCRLCKECMAMWNEVVKKRQKYRVRGINKAWVDVRKEVLKF